MGSVRSPVASPAIGVKYLTGGGAGRWIALELSGAAWMAGAENIGANRVGSVGILTIVPRAKLEGT